MADIFDTKGVHNQRYFFYNDEDGQSSFSNFLSQYKGKPGWKITNFPTFIVIEKRFQSHAIRLIANRPEAEADKALTTFLESLSIIPHMIIHRGHSYHAQNTLDSITQETKLIWLGSCGGYSNTTEVLTRSPNALPPFTTKGPGTKAINDRALGLLNEHIISQKMRGHTDFRIDDSWKSISEKLNTDPDFRKYVPPFENLNALFLQAYARLE
jgi:hypothetical protein